MRVLGDGYWCRRLPVLATASLLLLLLGALTAACGSEGPPQGTIVAVAKTWPGVNIPPSDSHGTIVLLSKGQPVKNVVAPTHHTPSARDRAGV